MFKILQARLHQHVNCELHMFKLDLEKAEDQRSNYQHLLDHQKSKRVPEKHLLLLYSKLWKIPEEMGIPDLPLEKPVCRSRSNS